MIIRKVFTWGAITLPPFTIGYLLLKRQEEIKIQCSRDKGRKGTHDLVLMRLQNIAEIVEYFRQQPGLDRLKPQLDKARGEIASAESHINLFDKWIWW